MNTIYLCFKRFVKAEDAVSAIEYALLASLIAVVVIGAVTTLGAGVSAKFTAIAAAL